MACGGVRSNSAGPEVARDLRHHGRAQVAPDYVATERERKAGLGQPPGAKVFPEVQAVLGLDAFVGDARADHLGEAVDVDRIEREAGLDLLAHRLGPGLGAEDPDLKRAGGGIGNDGNWCFCLGDVEGRVHSLRQRMEQREVGYRSEQAASEDDLLPADPIGQPAEEQEERCADNQCDGDHDVRRRAIDAHHLLEEEERVELARVPDHRLADDRAE